VFSSQAQLEKVGDCDGHLSWDEFNWI
jgi:hypothetical protein